VDTPFGQFVEAHVHLGPQIVDPLVEGREPGVEAAEARTHVGPLVVEPAVQIVETLGQLPLVHRAPRLSARRPAVKDGPAATRAPSAAFGCRLRVKRNPFAMLLRNGGTPQMKCGTAELWNAFRSGAP
jgi:hypothetical protein